MPAINPNQDYYAILQLCPPQVFTTLQIPRGVPQIAAQQVPLKEIRTAYYRLAKEYHPDRTGGDEAAADQFKQVLEAYEVLSNPELRPQYDNMRASAATAATARTSSYNSSYSNAYTYSYTSSYAMHTYCPSPATGTPAWIYQGYGFTAAPWGQSRPQAAPGTYTHPSPWSTQTAAYYHYNQQPQRPPTPDPRQTQPKSIPPASPHNLEDMFNIYPFSHYYHENFQENAFLKELREKTESERAKLHKAQEQVNIALNTMNQSWYNTTDEFVRMKLEEEYATRQQWQSRCQNELAKREALLVGHEARARDVLHQELRRGVFSQNRRARQKEEAEELERRMERILQAEMEREKEKEREEETQREREEMKKRQRWREMRRQWEKEANRAREKEMRRASVKSEVEAGNVELIEIDE